MGWSFGMVRPSSTRGIPEGVVMPYTWNMPAACRDYFINDIMERDASQHTGETTTRFECVSSDAIRFEWAKKNEAFFRELFQSDDVSVELRDRNGAPALRFSLSGELRGSLLAASVIAMFVRMCHADVSMENIAQQIKTSHVTDARRIKAMQRIYTRVPWEKYLQLLPRLVRKWSCYAFEGELSGLNWHEAVPRIMGTPLRSRIDDWSNHSKGDTPEDLYTLGHFGLTALYAWVMLNYLVRDSGSHPYGEFQWDYGQIYTDWGSINANSYSKWGVKVFVHLLVSAGVAEIKDGKVYATELVLPTPAAPEAPKKPARVRKPKVVKDEAANDIRAVPEVPAKRARRARG